MAVGDPNQSIYGWRGASADNLSSFHQSFGGTSARSSTTLSLSVSWRNPRPVLEVANLIAEPLNEASSVLVPRLRSREEYLQLPRDHEPQGNAAATIETHFVETIAEEFDALARWMRDEREAFRQLH